MTELSIDPTVPRQQFRQSFDGAAYTVELLYNTRTDCYWISLYDADGSPLIQGVRVAADAVLFRGRRGSSFPAGRLICVSDTGLTPAYGELGTSAAGSPARILYQLSSEA